jgi:hypothetical protein
VIVAEENFVAKEDQVVVASEKDRLIEVTNLFKSKKIMIKIKIAPYGAIFILESKNL